MLQLLILLLSGVVAALALIARSTLLRKVTNPYQRGRARIHFPWRVMSMLRQAARNEHAADVLRLMESLLHFQRSARRTPSLPVSPDGTPRMMLLARSLAEENDLTADAMLEALMEVDPPATPAEVDALPVCTAIALAERLTQALRVLRDQPSRQLEAAEDIRCITRDLQMLRRMNWTVQSEAADDVHAQLCEDPSGLYGRMDAASRRMLRLRVELLCRRSRMDAADVLHAALSLCRDADGQGLEGTLPYWLLDGAGLMGLFRALRRRRGRFTAWCAGHPVQLRYGMLLGFSVVMGFIFIQVRQPVLLVPFFCGVMGCISRWALRHWPLQPIPTVEDVPEGLRTLVMLPTVLADEHAAIRAARRMKVLRCALPRDAMILLLGDFPERMSPVSPAAQAIMTAAASAVMALDGTEGRVMYIQRSRARGGMQGAIETVCRLVTHCECEDVLTCATVEPASLHRQYDYVLTIPEAARMAPGLLQRLMRVLCHPLCTHYPTPRGHRGYSAAAPERDAGIRLITPSAWLEHVDGIVPPGDASAQLLDGLGGCIRVPGAFAQQDEPTALMDVLAAFLVQCRTAWHEAAWQLPWVQTRHGLVRNPLGFLGRFDLREGLRASLMPLAQCVTALWAVISHQWWLLLIALLLPDGLRLWPREKSGWLKMLCLASMLPTRAVLGVLGMLQGLSRRDADAPSWAALEMWGQGLAATVVAALALALPGMNLLPLLTAALFACFPWAHRLYDAPAAPHAAPDAEQMDFLASAAQATWNYFAAQAADGRVADVLQVSPAVAAASTTLRTMAGYLLAIVSARETGDLSVPEAARRLDEAASVLLAWPTPYGLPCERCDLATLTVQDAQVDAGATGLLLCAVMTAAQALRTWLPEMPQEFSAVSAQLMHFLDGVDVMKLWDASSGLFYQGLDVNGQPLPHSTQVADECLLLSVAAAARGIISAEHLLHLSRTQLRIQGHVLPLTRHGAAEDVLLAGLFLPISHVSGFIRAMMLHGQEGFWGQGHCLCGPVDAALRYRQGCFGLAQAALDGTEMQPVFSPGSAALALPHLPKDAAAVLRRYAEGGFAGELGFFDALDAASGQPAAAYSTWHQGVMMAALAHITADAPVMRYFCALPEVEALLPLLHAPIFPMQLRALPVPDAAVPALPLADRAVDARLHPSETHLLGDADFSVAADACGRITLRAGDVSCIREMALYVADSGRVYRVGDASLDGESIFEPGAVRISRLCGSVKATLLITVDAVQHRLLHLLTVTNLSTRDRRVDVADCLLPDMAAANGTIETVQDGHAHLAAHARGIGRRLHHRYAAFPPAVVTAVCTDAQAFIGRGRTLDHPAALEEAPTDLHGPSLSPCLSFRMRLALSGRAQASVLFATSMDDLPLPALAEIPGITELCAMQQQAMARTCGLRGSLALAAGRLAGLIGSTTALYAPPSLLDDAHALQQWCTLHGYDLAIAPEADADLVLQDGLPVLPQIAAHYTHRTAAEPASTPAPGHLPETEVDFPNGCGGIDPQTGDLFIRLQPWQTTPAPWQNRHRSGPLLETVDESGDGMEDVLLRLADGTEFTPWTLSLPRMVRMASGTTSWQCEVRGLSVALHAACIPGLRLRILRVKGETEGIALMVNGIAMPLDEHGEAVWTLSAAGEIHQRTGLHASDVLRAIRSEWVQRLQAIAITTPDAALDRLISRVLPMQCFTCDEASSIAALPPLSALRRLLRAAQRAHASAAWLDICFALAVYCHRAGDAVCDVHLPGFDETLLARCTAAIFYIPEDAAARELLLHALAAQALLHIRADEALKARLDQWRSALQADHWRGTHYGDAAVQLDVQCLAALLFGSTPRTVTAMRTALDALRDGPLLRNALPTDAPPLPGLPENGGLPMRTAIAAIAALLELGMAEEAWALLSAINPVRSTSSPLDAETSCASPIALAGGLCASPMPLGLAIPIGGDGAAGWLYHLLLTRLLGFQRTGNIIRLQPQVPEDWAGFTITLQEDGATWRITCERQCEALTIDGVLTPGDGFTIADDGRVHQVHLPLP